MYTNYGNYPVSNNSGAYSSYNNQMTYHRPGGNQPGNDRIGGFLFPFVLGGLTGGLLAPNFYPRPYYNNYYYPYPPYQYPYYR